MKLLKVIMPFEVFEDLNSRLHGGIYDEKGEIAIYPYECFDALNYDRLVIELRAEDVEVYIQVIEV